MAATNRSAAWHSRGCPSLFLVDEGRRSSPVSTRPWRRYTSSPRRCTSLPNVLARHLRVPPILALSDPLRAPERPSPGTPASISVPPQLTATMASLAARAKAAVSIVVPHFSSRQVGVVVSAGKMDRAVKVRIAGQEWNNKFRRVCLTPLPPPWAGPVCGASY